MRFDQFEVLKALLPDIPDGQEFLGGDTVEICCVDTHQLAVIVGTARGLPLVCSTTVDAPQADTSMRHIPDERVV